MITGAVLALAGSVLIGGARAQNGTCRGVATSQEWWANAVAADYDASFRPKHAMALAAGDAVIPEADVVEVQYRMLSLKGVNSIAREMTVQVYERMWWTDARLAWGAGADGPECMDAIDILRYKANIWRPDVVVENMAAAMFSQAATASPQMLVVTRNGSIYSSRMLLLTLSCDMHFGRMPFDTHHCPIHAASYIYSSDDLRVVSRGATPDVPGTGVSLSSGDKIQNPIWTVEDAETIFKTGGSASYATYSVMSMRSESIFNDISQDWDYVEATIKLGRKPRYFVVNALIPDAIFLFFVYAGFYIDRGAVPARVACYAIGLLIERTMINSIYASLPPISYSVWLTDYLLYSLILIALTSAQYAVVSFLVSREKTANAIRQAINAHRGAILSKLDAVGAAEVAETREEGEARRADAVAVAPDAADIAASWPPDSATSFFFGSTKTSDAEKKETEEAETADVGVVVKSDDGDDEDDARAAAEEKRDKFEAAAAAVRGLSPAARILVERVRARYLAALHPGESRIGVDETRGLLADFNVVVSKTVMAHLWSAMPHGATIDFDDFLRLVLDIDFYVELALQKTHTKSTSFGMLPRSLQLDIAARYVFPVLVITKSICFFALVKYYPN